MCDLWKNTLTYSVPIGAIPAQIDHALSSFRELPQQIKLYNSGSFFDPAAIPPEDYIAIAQRIAFAERVVVECHPRLIGKSALAFRDLLRGRLEVAMGLETANPGALDRLNKKFTLDQFATAADFLRANEIALRVFLLVNPPFIHSSAVVEWILKSASIAFDCGAGAVSLIPTRAGNGAMDRLEASGEWTRPSVQYLEEAFDGCLDLRRGRVFADTWNLDEFSSCAECLPVRSQRLEQMNLTQHVAPSVTCKHCVA